MMYGTAWYYVQFVDPVMYDPIKRNPRGLRKLQKQISSSGVTSRSRCRFHVKRDGAYHWYWFNHRVGAQSWRTPSMRFDWKA